MAKNSAQNCVLFVERNKISVYHPALKVIVGSEIPDTIIKDLEIKKTAELEKIITQILQQNKIPTSDPFFIIIGESAVIAEKLPNTTKQDSKEKVEKAIKLAPFNHVGWTIVQSGKDLILIMVNRELFEGIQDILERLGYRVAAVTVITALGLNQASFSIQQGKEIIKRTALVKQNSLIFDPEMALEAENAVSPDPRRNKKLLALLVVLGVLVLLLGGLLLKMTLFPDKPTVQKEKTVETILSPTPAPTQPTPETTATASAETPLDQVRIQVLNASGEIGLADKTKKRLLESGFLLIETGNAETVTSPKIQVVFAPGLSTKIRETLVSELSKTYPEQAVREASPSGNFDVVVTLTAGSL